MIQITLDSADTPLRIPAGEYIGLTGPSGSGKSRFLHYLGLVEPLPGGAYWLDDERVDGLSRLQADRLRRTSIGCIFQPTLVIDQLTLADNIGLGLGDISTVEREARIENILACFGLQHLAALPARLLSMGQRQCLAIARAVAPKPALLLADEPTTHLDAFQSRSAMDLLQALHANGSTIIVATSHPAVLPHAQRIIELRDGRIEVDARREL